jgi:hypothetical protein
LKDLVFFSYPEILFIRLQWFEFDEHKVDGSDKLCKIHPLNASFMQSPYEFFRDPVDNNYHFKYKPVESEEDKENKKQKKVEKEKKKEKADEEKPAKKKEKEPKIHLKVKCMKLEGNKICNGEWRCDNGAMYACVYALTHTGQRALRKNHFIYWAGPLLDILKIDKIEQRYARAEARETPLWKLSCRG